MSEKRFTGEFDKELSGIYDNGEQLTNFEVVDLLNELGRIIFDQRHNLGQLMDIISNMNRKNEQLKNEIKDLNDVLARYEEKHQEECICEYMKMIGEDALNEMKSKNKELKE